MPTAAVQAAGVEASAAEAAAVKYPTADAAILKIAAMHETVSNTDRERKVVPVIGVVVFIAIGRIAARLIVLTIPCVIGVVAINGRIALCCRTPQHGNALCLGWRGCQ